MVGQRKQRIAFLDDSPTVRQVLSCVLADGGYDAQACATWNELKEALRPSAPDLVLLDVEMPQILGEHIGYVLRRDFPELRVVFLSDHDESTLRAMSEATGVQGYIRKSPDPEQLLGEIAAFLPPPGAEDEPPRDG
jgi:CheY-like chemotaxis protein